MLAGVLLRYVIGVPGAALAMPEFVAPLAIAYFSLRLLAPMYTVPVVVGLGLVFAAMAGALAPVAPSGLTPLVLVVPQFSWQALIGIGVPLYLVTMASQNLPGFAVLKSHGYEPQVQSSLLVTGLGSVISAFSGAHAVNLAAITAAIVMGSDTHPDAQQRWKAVVPYSIAYVVIGLFAGTAVAYLGAMPAPIITAVAGLALFAPLMGGASAMMKSPDDVEAALLTFIVTGSGFTVFGIGAAFWGLLAGLLLWGAKSQLRGAGR
jgi:benzoate membrane transport protein